MTRALARRCPRPIEVLRIPAERVSTNDAGELVLDGVVRTRLGGWLTVTTESPDVPFPLRTIRVRLCQSSIDGSTDYASIGVTTVLVGDVQFANLDEFHQAFNHAWFTIIKREIERAFARRKASGIRLRKA